MNSKLLPAYYTFLNYFLALLAIVLVSWNFNSWSLTNDELSALNRLNHANFSDLIKNGIQIDGHPALTQIFLYYWIKIAGVSTFSLRLPSILSALAGLYFFYQFSKNWFNVNVAQLSLLTLLLSQFFLNYAQLARPYAYGFFGVMLLAYSTERLQNKPSLGFQEKTLFVLGVLIAFSSHYFASLSALLWIFISFVKFPSKRRKTYLILCLISLLILIPHIPITIGHLKIGGLTWLPIPEPSFLKDFLYYVFNENLTFSILLISIVLIGFVLGMRQKSISYAKSNTLLIAGISPFCIGYYYSINYSPVLQFSTLLFSLPFLILCAHSFIPEKGNGKIQLVLLGLIMAAGGSSLYSADNYFKSRPFANFKEVLTLSLASQEANQPLAFANTNEPKYFNFFEKELGKKILFDIPQFLGPNEIATARNLIEEAESEKIMLSFAGIPIPLEVYELAKEKYPIQAKRKRFFNSEFLLLQKGTQTRPTILNENFETAKLNWEINQANWNDSIFNSYPKSYLMPAEELYAASLKASLKDLVTRDAPYLVIKLKLKSEAAANLKVVVDVKRKDESIYWRAFDSQAYHKEGQWYTMIGVWTRPIELKDEDTIMVYLWNPDKSDFYIDDFELINYTDNDYNFYKR